jgi:hypothetical protein
MHTRVERKNVRDKNVLFLIRAREAYFLSMHTRVERKNVRDKNVLLLIRAQEAYLYQCMLEWSVKMYARGACFY